MGKSFHINNVKKLTSWTDNMKKTQDVWAWVITVHAVIKVEEYILSITRYFNDDIGTKWQKVHFHTFSSLKWILHNIHNVLSNTPRFSAIGKTRTKNCQFDRVSRRVNQNPTSHMYKITATEHDTYSLHIWLKIPPIFCQTQRRHGTSKPKLRYTL